MGTIQDIVDRTRFYVDDNHKVTDGWKDPNTWLKLVSTELLACYRKFVRENAISLRSFDTQFTGSTYAFDTVAPATNPMVIIGVVENLGSGNYRPILPAQSELGREPFWDNPATATTGIYWTLERGFDTVVNGVITPSAGYTLSIHPPVSATYIVRYIPTPLTDASKGDVLPTSTTALPDELEDYVAMRVAQKALASEGASSQALKELMLRSEAEWKMTSFGTSTSDGARVRIRPRAAWKSTLSPFTWNVNPYTWYYIK
jgi:hypothetical protein